MQNLKLLPDIRQSPAYACFMESIGWQVFQFCSKQTYLKRIPLTPWKIMKIQRFNWPIDLKKLLWLARKNKVLLLKLEPLTFPRPEVNKQLAGFGFKQDPWTLAPSKTLWLNLKPSKKQLLGQMKPKTRYNIGLAQKKGLKVEVLKGKKATDEKLRIFYRIWQQRGKKIGLWLPHFNQLKSLKKAFQKDFWLFLTQQENKTLAGLVVLKHQQTAWYWHNASIKDGQRLFAPTLLTWEAIKLSKRSGCQLFDLEGLYDQRFHQQTKKWQGFSHFKKGFGGQEVTLAGTFSKWCNIFKWV